MSASVHVPFDECGAVGNPGFDGALLRQLHHLRVELDAQRAGAAFGGRDHHPAVSGAQIDYEVVGRHLRQVQHFFDDLG